MSLAPRFRGSISGLFALRMRLNPLMPFLLPASDPMIEGRSLKRLVDNSREPALTACPEATD